MGRLYKYIPSIVIIHVGVAIEIGLSLFLIFWERSPNLYAVFGFVIGWGICDAVWNAFLAGLDITNCTYTCVHASPPFQVLLTHVYI